MHSCSFFNFRRRGSANIVFTRVMVFVCSLVVLLSGTMLLDVGKAQAVAGTSVTLPSVTTWPETLVARNHNVWSFQFTTSTTGSLNIGDVITIEYPEGFSISTHPSLDFANNRIYSNTPIITVNDEPVSSILISGQQLQIHVTHAVAAESLVNLAIVAEAVSNPKIETAGSIRLWTSSDTVSENIPVTIEGSSVTVSLSNGYEGAQGVTYTLTFRTRLTIDIDNPISPLIPYELVESMYDMDASKVLVDGVAASRISLGEGIYIYPGSDTNIAAGETVTLQFTAEAGMNNPVFEDEGELTQEIGVRFESLYEIADVTYLEDKIAPIGSLAVHGITPSGTTFSRSILLDLSATDGGSGIAGYELSEEPESFYGGENILDYESQVPYLLSSGAGPKTIYVKFYDCAGNPSAVSQVAIIYDNKLNLESLAVKDESSVNVALSPTFSDANNVYDAVVSSTVNTLRINFSKSATAGIVLDSRAIYTPTDSTSGEITFSNLAFGSNDLKIRVSATEGNKDYHLVIYKEGPTLKHTNNTTVINNGSIVLIGGEKWILSDKDKRQLILLKSYTGCALYESRCDWDGSGSSWFSEGDNVYDGYRYDPTRSDNIAHELNHGFLNSLGTGSSYISLYPFDNTTYYAESVPSRWSIEHRVKASVGLLSIPQYQSLKLAGTGVLNRLMGSEWFLMNPAHAGIKYYVYSVNAEGNLAADSQSKNVHPVVYLKSDVSIKGGSGDEVNPYTFISSNANISSIKLQNIDLGQDSSDPPVFSLVVSNSITNTALDVTMEDSTASISIEQPTGGAQASVDALDIKKINVTGLPVGVTTVHVHGLAEDTITRKNYDIRIIREAPVVLSDNANLSSLRIGDTALGIIPNQPSQSITASVANNVYSTTIVAAVYQSGATMTIANGPSPGTGITTYRGNHPVNLNEGINVFTIVVTAPNGTTTVTYTLNITRAQSGSSGGQAIQQQLTAALDLLNPLTFLGGNVTSSQITGKLMLPTTTGTGGYPIMWTSNNISISSDGTVTRPVYTSTELSQVVTLTATATVTNTTYTSLPRYFQFTVLRALMPQQDVAVTTAQPLVTFAGGTTINFTGATFGPGAKVSVTEVTPLNTSGTGLISAGRTLEFKLEGITIDPSNPVKVSIPMNSGADRSKIGIFFYNPTTQEWEYQKTQIDSTGAAFTYVTHFSTYGVFEANKIAPPTWDDSMYTNDSTKQVTLSTSTAGAAIYYTLDGSSPTSASVLYDVNNKPKLTSTQSLKATAVKNGMVTSDELTIPGTARKTIANILTSIFNKNDQNGDGQFNGIDVRALLLQVETLHGK